MGRRLGLVIGVNSYQDATFPSLQFAETDARALAQWLVHTRGGQWSPADVQVVLGANATRELSETLISQLCLHMATPADLVLIYFAGHAFIDQASGEGCLACTNTRYQQSGSGLSLAALTEQVLARSPAAQILCILDCFQFGPAWNTRRSSPYDYKPLLGPTLQNTLQQAQGRLLYCSCRGNEMLSEVGERGLGSFMYRTIMGVSGPALDPNTGQITLQRLHAFLNDRLREQHRPQVFGYESRPLVLVGAMPAFQQKNGLLNNYGSPVPSAAPSDFSPGSHLAEARTMQMAGNPVAELSPTTSNMRPLPMDQVPPSTSNLGQLSAIEQQRMQQCEQMLGQAMQAFQAQQLQMAYQMVETILQINPTFSDALILKAQILAANGQFQEALNIIQEVVQRDPANALGWSMAAALLANLGQLPEAMSAVDRSLSIDPSNSETHSIKEMIREKLAELQFNTGKRSRLTVGAAQSKASESGSSFALAAGIQFLALLIGVAGAFLPLLAPALPKIISLILESLALATLVVSAGRGSFLYGVKRFLLSAAFSLLAGGLLALVVVSLYKTISTPLTYFLLQRIAVSYALLTPLAILLLWLGAAAVLSLLTGLVGLLAGIIARKRARGG